MVNKKICNHCNGHIVGTRLRGEGKWYSAEGYVCVRVLKSSKFFPMAIKKNSVGGMIPEHRLVMAQHLNRLLTAREHVYHFNGTKDDNRLPNLFLTSLGKHGKIIPAMQKRIQELEALLKKQG